jgi:hypothetical protein
MLTSQFCLLNTKLQNASAGEITNSLPMPATHSGMLELTLATCELTLATHSVHIGAHAPEPFRKTVIMGACVKEIAFVTMMPCS